MKSIIVSNRKLQLLNSFSTSVARFARIRIFFTKRNKKEKKLTNNSTIVVRCIFFRAFFGSLRSKFRLIDSRLFARNAFWFWFFVFFSSKQVTINNSFRTVHRNVAVKYFRVTIRCRTLEFVRIVRLELPIFIRLILTL